MRFTRMGRLGSLALAAILAAPTAHAQVTGTVRVSAHDQQDLPLPGADATLRSASSVWTGTAATGTDGEAVFPVVPVGQYVVTVSLAGFAPATKEIIVTSNAVTPVRFRLDLAGVGESVDVSVGVATVNPESSRTATVVGRSDILREPGADRPGSLAMITDNAPGTYVLHNHLHSRGGHGVSWEIDGVPVPSSALAAVGAQFDPQDIDSLEVNRGGLSPNLGDRAYGVFNVVPRSGFEGKRLADLTGTYGSQTLLTVHLALGDHTSDQRFAYFASAGASRTDFGLERVDVPVLHDAAHSVSGFTSIVYTRSADQLRFVGAVRTDRFQVPNTVEQQAFGLDDRQVGTDGLATLTWLHTSGAGNVLTVSPYYHFNRQQYLGGPADPIVTNDNRGSHYVGGYVSWALPLGRHMLRVGTDSFAEHDHTVLGLTQTNGSLRSATARQSGWSSVLAAFADDSFRATEWLTLNGGLRVERFAGDVTEHAASPRLGAAISVPGVGVLRGSYSRYYQHPSTSAIAGPLLDYAVSEGFGFLPLHGERDEVWEIGLGVPVGGWTLDLDAYRNRVDHLADHDVLGNSNLLLPLSIAHARVRAAEATLRSPRLFGRLQVHGAFAYQIAEGRGAITGGMTGFQPPAEGYFFLDHDQRVTFNSGASLDLPGGSWVSGSVHVGSGFLRGDGPAHLPGHTTADLAVGKTINDRLSLRLSATNVANTQYLTGLENSFAGTHYAAPREVAVQVRYKFHY